MAPEDLREYAGLTTTVVTCRQRVPLSTAGIALVKWSLEGMFGGIEVINEVKEEPRLKEILTEDEDSGSKRDVKIKMEDDSEEEGMVDETEPTESKEMAFRVMDCVNVFCKQGHVELEWEGNILNDGIADAILAILLTVESSPAAVKCEVTPLPLKPSSE